MPRGLVRPHAAGKSWRDGGVTVHYTESAPILWLHSESLFRALSARGHFDELGIELAEHGEQIALSGHDFADVFVGHRDFNPALISVTRRSRRKRFISFRLNCWPLYGSSRGRRRVKRNYVDRGLHLIENHGGFLRLPTMRPNLVAKRLNFFGQIDAGSNFLTQLTRNRGARLSD